MRRGGVKGQGGSSDTDLVNVAKGAELQRFPLHWGRPKREKEEEVELQLTASRDANC